MNNTLIVTGGEISKKFFSKIFKNNKFDNIIASDRGLEILDILNIKPNYIIGDFDSIDKKILNKYLDKKSIKIIRLKPEKDFTDTHMAFKLAIEINSDFITILGATGTRIDHVLGNIQVLKEALDNNVQGIILNENNKIRLINETTQIKLDKQYKYISLIPLTTKVEGVSLKGFKYLLKNSIIEIGRTVGISNEQTEEVATIEIKNGILILIQSKD